MARDVLLSLLLSALLSLAASQDAAFWNSQAQETLKRALNVQRNQGIAKNVVFFLGDGMDITTTTAARIFRGQLNGATGEETILAWDDFPYVALSKTYNTDQQVADSAGTATAFFCGVKSKAGTIGVDDQVLRGSCSSIADAAVDSLLHQANAAGKATGIVTTTRVTHATPGAIYAHCPDRNWENNADIPAEEADAGCTDIAWQLVQDNDFINVILGGGRQNFLTNETTDPEYNTTRGRRTDGIDLIDRWLSDKGPSAQYVWNSDAFQNVDPATTDYLLGLFEPSHMHYESARLNDTAGEPSIAEMTEKAIQLLSKDEDGFFLMVEGGRIDHSHHDGVARDAFYDTLALEDAVLKTLELTNIEDTLVVVTADHGHVMTFGGYPSRGTPLFGFDDSSNGTDDIPYLTITYANGPGGIDVAKSYNKTGLRPDHTREDYNAIRFRQDAVVPIEWETHGGGDVAIYALGPWAHLFHSTHEQNYIPHVVRFAACYVDGEDSACNYIPPTTEPCSGAPSFPTTAGFSVLVSTMMAFLLFRMTSTL